MRVPILKDQSTILVSNPGGVPLTVKMRAIGPTVVLWSQERSSLDGNVDAGGNPQGGMPMLNTDPVETLYHFQGVIWARASANTFVQVETYQEATSNVVVSARPSAPIPPRTPKPKWWDSLGPESGGTMAAAASGKFGQG